VVTNAFKGEDFNHYDPIFKRYHVPVLYNYRDEDMQWVEYRPKARLHVLHKIFPEGIKIPDYFFGKNIVHLPTIKCVSGDTEVLLGDGTPIRIRELFERELRRTPSALVEQNGATHVPSDAVLLAMTPRGAIKPCRVAVVSRSWADRRKSIELKTKTGRSLSATADHLVKTPEGWRPLGELVRGDRIAIARRITLRGESQKLPQTHAQPPMLRIDARAGRKYDVPVAQRMIDEYQSGATVTAIASEMGVPWQSVQRVLTRHEVVLRRNVTQVRIPSHTSPGFWRWLGYVIAEGCIERTNGCDKLWWVNQESGIRAEFVALTKELFGLEPKPSGPKFYLYSRNLGAFLEELGLEVPLHAGNKRVPEALFRCPDHEVLAFLAGYLDGDGHVTAAQAEVSSVTKSAELARDIATLYSRLGVVAFVKPFTASLPGRWAALRTYYRVTVSGAGVQALARALELRHPMKAKRLAEHAERLAESKQPSNWDVVPLPAERMRALRQSLGLTQAATGLPSSVNNIEHGHTHPTPRIARQVLDRYARADSNRVLATELAELAMLASEDLAWDVVNEIGEDPNAGLDLYDVSVPEAGCFLANGLVAHNCHIYTTTTGAMKNAFGGLLSTKRHYTHSWIHRTLVDLLAIQKEIHSGLFAVMDGTTAGNGPGPRTMFPVIKDYMLASEDQVAIDAVAAKMMGFDPMSLEFIRVAHDDGLGVGDPRDIDVVGDDVKKENWGFVVGDNAASKVGDVMWFGAMKPFQKLFFHTPLVNVFVLGSEAYHDYYRWPKKDRKVFEDWKQSTTWGQLFSAYERGESDRVLHALTAAQTAE
jgi:intein/homing endonuclease